MRFQMNNSLRNLVTAASLITLCSGLHAATVTQTVVRPLPSYKAVVPIPAESCTVSGPHWTRTYDPALPPNAEIISDTINVSIDDGAHLTGKTTLELMNCGKRGWSRDITDYVNDDGSFTIELYDNPSGVSELEWNEVAFSGVNTITYILTNAVKPETSPTNSEPELCYGDCSDRAAALCPIQPLGCSGCDSRGSPRPSFSVANMDLTVADTPIWQDVAVGPSLRVDMRFSNYANTEGNRTFGPKWSCNWNSSIFFPNAQTAVVEFASGAIAEFVLSNGVYRAPGTLAGELTCNGTVCQYRKPDGRVWQYTPSSGDTNRYLLESLWDAWSNTVTVTYSDDRLYRITQTVPASGRYLEFTYSGTNTKAVSITTQSPLTRTSLFHYAASGYLTNVVDMGGYSYSYEYTNGYLAGIIKAPATPRLKVTYSITPDQWTNAGMPVITLEDAAGQSRRYTWEYSVVREAFGLESTTNEHFHYLGTAGSRGTVRVGTVDSSGVEENYQYSSDGRVTNITDRGGATVNYAYNTQKRKTAMTDELGNTTTYVYGTNGVDLLYIIPPTGAVQRSRGYIPGKHAVASETNALGQVTAYDYNTLGLATNITDGRVDEVRCYNTEGRLVSMSRNGILMETNRYDALGRLVWQRNAAGLIVTNAYDGLNRLTAQVFDNNGKISSVEYVYGCCALEQMFDRNGNEWLYQFNDIGQKEWEINPAGLTNLYRYGLAGQPIIISNSLEWTTNAYTSEGLLESVTYPKRPAYDNDQHAENFWYDAEGRLIKKQIVSGAFYLFDYDAAGRRTGAYVPNGLGYETGDDRVIQSESNRYDVLGRLIWTRDIRGMAVSIEYNDMGWETQKSYPDGTTEQWTYNPWGDVTGYKDRIGRVSSNLYDNLGRRTQQITPDGVSIFYAYTDAGQIASVSNVALGAVWQYHYDAEGRAVTNEYPDGTVEQRFYDPAGNVTQILAGGITTVFSYDELNNRTATRVGSVLVESNRYDGLSHLVWSMDADGLVTSNSYDNWGALAQRTLPGDRNEYFEYVDSRMDKTISPLGISTEYQRDSLGQLLRMTDGAGRSNIYGYVTNGTSQMASLTDGNGNTTCWSWDLFGNTTNKSYADTSAESFEYDALGRLTNRTMPNGIGMTATYTLNGDIAATVYDGTQTVEFAYDALGRRTNMTDTLGTTVWTNSIMGRILSEDGPFSDDLVTIAYDSLGRMTNVGFAGYTWSYAFDALGRITNVTAPEGSYSLSWNAGGTRRAAVTWPNGTVGGYSYDPSGRLTGLNWSNGSASLLEIAYGYDDGNRRTNEIWTSGRNTAYQYDNANQLLSSDSTLDPRDNASYSYDKAGNPLQRREPGLNVSNEFNSLNQLSGSTWKGLTVIGQANYGAGTVTVNGVTAQLYTNGLFSVTNLSVSAGSDETITAVFHGPAFTNTACVATDEVTVAIGTPACGYDPNGNMTEDSRSWYYYDLADRLIRVVSKETSNTVLECSYDGLGRRREVTRDGTNIERYVYLPGTFLVLAVLDETDSIKEIYTYGPDLSGTLSGAGGVGGILGGVDFIESVTNAMHSDALGNIVMLTDGDGAVAATYQYGPFGKITGQTGTRSSRFMFSSKEYDPEAGLCYFGYRFYNPTLGRWINRDPIGEQGGINLYGFVRNTPVNLIDLYGLQGQEPCCIDGMPVDCKALKQQLQVLNQNLLRIAEKKIALSLAQSKAIKEGPPGALPAIQDVLGGAVAVAGVARTRTTYTALETTRGLPMYLKGGQSGELILTGSGRRVVSGAGGALSLISALVTAQEFGCQLGEGNELDAIMTGAQTGLGGLGAASGTSSALKTGGILSGSVAGTALVYAGAFLSIQQAAQNYVGSIEWLEMLDILDSEWERLYSLSKHGFAKRYELMQLEKKCCP